MTEFSEQVEEYIREDRQWPRHLRINHARMQLAKAGSELSRNFWRAILQRNED